MEKTKLVIAGHDLKFASLIMNYIEQTGDYEIREDKWAGHNLHDEDFSQECLEWADIILCEWGLGNAVWYSQNKRPHQKLIVRMHRQELDTDYPNQFVLDNIDKIIAISPYIYEEFYRAFKLPREKMSLIFNALDASNLDLPKQKDAEFNLGIIGINPMMKRLDLALDIFEKLWETDNRYKLFIKGKRPEEILWLWRNEEQRAYYEEQYSRIETAPWKDSVQFDGFGEMSEWFQKIGYVLSTSDFESFHLAPAEGMASGAIPVVLNWDGSETIYKKDYIFDSTDRMIENILYLNDDSRFLKQQELVKKEIASFDIQEVGLEFKKLIEHLR